MIDDLLITDTDFTAAELASMAQQTKPPADPAKEIENKVAPRPAEAKLIRVIDQATLDAVGDRLAINKALQKEAASVFKPIKEKTWGAHQEVLAQEKRVMGPLQEEEKLLKLASDTFLAEQERIERARQERERIAREAEERRLIAEAETVRKEQERVINERIQREHEEEVERAALAAEAAGSWPEDVAAIIETPAPEYVSIPLDIPVMPAVVLPREVPAIQVPKGMSRRTSYKAEVFNLSLLCRAVADGKVSSNYVEANMSALNKRAVADEGKMDVPGVRAVPVSGIAQRTR